MKRDFPERFGILAENLSLVFPSQYVERLNHAASTVFLRDAFFMFQSGCETGEREGNSETSRISWVWSSRINLQTPFASFVHINFQLIAFICFASFPESSENFEDFSICIFAMISLFLFIFLRYF
jgi:hypothetical protein